ncbi:MAG: methyltransferase type 11, partial [Sediminibacterium sp.]|nr:methyltransferase type 11 [Sediminibacterium sp.]
MKRYLKYLIYKFHLAGWLDKALYHASGLRNKKANTAYRLTHPDLNFPPDYFLYETFRLDYRKFIEDGELTAKELLEWIHPYLPVKDPAILDWGCGAARIIRHLPALVPGAALYGCDINEEMITWDKAQHGEIAFTTVNNFFTLPYAPTFFDIVYGLSVLTHISA